MKMAENNEIITYAEVLGCHLHLDIFFFIRNDPLMLILRPVWDPAY